MPYYTWDMLDLDEAMELALRAAREMPRPVAVRVPVAHAVGRVLAETVYSPINIPTNDYSAMDGFALRASDVPGKGLELPVRGECRTGHPSIAVPDGSCVRIFTGAPIPSGADTVVMQENVKLSERGARFDGPLEAGENIRREGEDLRRGDRVLEPGVRLDPFHLALLSTIERTEVLVYARARVTIACTGDELRPAGALAEPGQLAESNSLALSALVRELGGEPERAPLVRDESKAMKDALHGACQRSDLLVTVGGVSVGDHDLVRPTLEALGADVLFHKVRIKPGKPVLLARLGRALVLGLPGNPSSAQVIMSVLGAPLLRVLSGRSEYTNRFSTARLRKAFRQKPGRVGYYRGVLRGSDVEILDNQASGATTSLAWANCFVVIGQNESELPDGVEVPILCYGDLR